MTDETNPVPTSGGPGRAAFAFIFVTVLLDMMALGIVIPVLPKLIKAFMGGIPPAPPMLWAISGRLGRLCSLCFSRYWERCRTGLAGVL